MIIFPTHHCLHSEWTRAPRIGLMAICSKKHVFSIVMDNIGYIPVVDTALHVQNCARSLLFILGACLESARYTRSMLGVCSEPALYTRSLLGACSEPARYLFE